jgi:hypothetical protein
LASPWKKEASSDGAMVGIFRRDSLSIGSACFHSTTVKMPMKTRPPTR